MTGEAGMARSQLYRMIPKEVRSSSESAIETFKRCKAFVIHSSKDSPRERFRQHYATHSVNIRSKPISGETCFDLWLCADRERGAPDDDCKPSISQGTLKFTVPYQKLLSH
eukprot:5681535-Pyramimonas_sp.AAC.1